MGQISCEPLCPKDFEQRRAEARRRALEIAETMSEAEDAALRAAAEADPDNPPLTEEQFARTRPAYGAAGRAAEFLRRRAGDAKPGDMLAVLEQAGREPPSQDDQQEV